MRYAIEMHIADIDLAGTDGDITMNIGGEGAEETGWFVYLYDRINAFERNSFGTMTYDSPIDLKELTEVRIKVQEKGLYPDAIIEYVKVTDERGLVWVARNPGPMNDDNGWIFKNFGGEYRWEFQPYDLPRHNAYWIGFYDKIKKQDDVVKNKSEKEKRDREQADLEAKIDQAKRDIENKARQKELDDLNRKAGKSGGVSSSWELTRDGNGWFYTKSGVESSGEDSPHPGDEVAGLDFKAFSGGQTYRQLGLPGPILTYGDGTPKPAIAEVAYITQAAESGKPWAQTIAKYLGIPYTQRFNPFSGFFGP